MSPNKILEIFATEVTYSRTDTRAVQNVNQRPGPAILFHTKSQEIKKLVFNSFSHFLDTITIYYCELLLLINYNNCLGFLFSIFNVNGT